MTNRRYEVVEVRECEHGWLSVCDHLPVDDRGGSCLRLDCNVLHGVACPGGSSVPLSSIPDDLVEKAARVLWHLGVGVGSESRRLARAALSVLFEEE